MVAVSSSSMIAAPVAFENIVEVHQEQEEHVADGITDVVGHKQSLNDDEDEYNWIATTFYRKSSCFSDDSGGELGEDVEEISVVYENDDQREDSDGGSEGGAVDISSRPLNRVLDEPVVALVCEDGAKSKEDSYNGDTTVGASSGRGEDISIRGTEDAHNSPNFQAPSDSNHNPKRSLDGDTPNTQVSDSTVSPIKRRRIQTVNAKNSIEVISKPLFGRSQFTSNAILECQLKSEVREIKEGISILKSEFHLLSPDELILTDDNRDEIYSIIHQLYNRSSKILEDFYGVLASSSRATRLINEVKELSDSLDNMFSNVRNTLGYISFDAKISVASPVAGQRGDRTNLLMKDILTTITRLWLEMDKVYWKDLVAVNKQNIGRIIYI